MCAIPQYRHIPVTLPTSSSGASSSTTPISFSLFTVQTAVAEDTFLRQQNQKERTPATRMMAPPTEPAMIPIVLVSALDPLRLPKPLLYLHPWIQQAASLLFKVLHCLIDPYQ
jgi:hypothetical protein